MKISIFGLGYVGVVSLACLARDGHTLIGVDLDRHKLDLMRQGKSPIIEPGLPALVSEVVASGRVEVSDDANYAIANSEISFVCVGTPARPNGSQDLTSVTRLAGQLGDALKRKPEYHLIVIRSTVLPGTVEDVLKPIIEQHSSKQSDREFGLCFQPEFLREGSSIRDYDNPPYTLVGTESDRPTKLLESIFGHLPCEFIRTTIRTAEMLKYACNAFHALKITFANEMGRLSQALGVDSHTLMDLVCRDKRLNISPVYLKPGFAFGGSCLPKDLQALLQAAKVSDVAVPMLSGIPTSNQIHIEKALDVILATGKKSVGMIGLSFKTGTDDLRESPLVVLAERLIGKGARLQIYDPQVYFSNLFGANRQYIEKTIPHIASLMCEQYEEVVQESQVIIVGINSEELIQKLYTLVNKDHFVLDLVNITDKERLPCAYRGICW
jgi:GDP-mannose 6-dehydrogenase